MKEQNDKKTEHPGVSGQERQGQNWFNSEEYLKQREFIEEMDDEEQGFSAQGRGYDQMGRSDISNQEQQEPMSLSEAEVIEALKRSPEVDISHVKISVEGDSVTFEGIVDGPREERALENIVENLRGINRVVNHLKFRH